MSDALSSKKLVPFGLRDILFGEYQYNDQTGAITYANQTVLGRGITANFDLKFAEGRLYSSGALSRYKKKLTGGTISLAVEALSLAVQASIFKADTSEVDIGTTGSAKKITGIGYGENTRGRYVGIATYVPADDSDDSDAFICIFVRKAMFGPPSMTYQTENDSIQWTTPTTTGEFISPDRKSGTTAPLMMEIAEVDSETDALAWCKKQLQMTA